MLKIRILTTFNRRLLPFSQIRSASDWVPQEKVTHTGQKWDKNDYRLARFIGRPKHVNPNFAIDLIDKVPPIKCKERVVWCDGGSGPTGHPKVYINLDKPGNHACGYCGLRFELDHCH
ncbi:probable NADH dehydrogenase [ubiquinone] iron-sulfur protein 6, mitochondrial [Onthophagus taurus]|uniref:probable NADH dehydrogenase [ubiquinone] iron-sulfur protein 6, mitochondrial n=1 Tax=Onthophagus taurus TaxID=166361 RepID=UPI000C1FDBA4|nr:probable NADH dehydrogenase [ubiquinone] iron-sulfur protein 6, mitochondrial [Onthophagus taurus]